MCRDAAVGRDRGEPVTTAGISSLFRDLKRSADTISPDL